MSTVKDAFLSARTLLGDDLGLNWTDQILMPKIIQAHNEMVNQLILSGLKPTRKNIGPFTVLTGVLDMGVNQPTDLDQPIKMSEMPVGGTISDSTPMIEVAFLPEETQTDFLRYWSFNGGIIKFLGATTDRAVRLYYQGFLTPPTKVTDSLVIVLSETFLGPRTAALAVMKSDPKLYAVANQIAQENLSILVRTAIKSDQIPVRRRPFSARSLRRGI